MAVLVLASQGKLHYDQFLFCNVGGDSENPATLKYVENVAKPYAAQHGLPLVELHRTRRDGTPETLYGRLTKLGSRSLPIPVRMANGAPGNRTCTADFKIKLAARHAKRNGATARRPAVMGLGISLDEWHRARSSSGIAWQTLEYPLLDLRLRRQDCMQIITDAGLPVPPKSSCWFCPFHTTNEWRKLKREQPELFAQSVGLERLLNERRAELGKDDVWLTRFGIPLDQVVAGVQLTIDQAMEELDVCESGYCMV